MTRFNPYAAQIKFAQAVNDALIHRVKFFIYRTVEGKVQKCELRMIDIDLQNGDLNLDYKVGDEIKFEKATEQDLKLISQQARQLEAAHKSKGR